MYDLEYRVQRLESRDEVRRLVRKCGVLLDECDIDALVDLFGWPMPRAFSLRPT